MRVYIFCIFVLMLSLVQAQDSTKIKRRETIVQNLDTLRSLEVEKKNFKFTPFIAPSYSPELEFLISAGGLISFSLDKDNKYVNRSSIPFSFGISSNGSLQGSVKGILYGKGDRWRLSGELWGKDMPDHYWGVGYDEVIDTPQSDSTTAYHRSWWRVLGKFTFLMKGKLYIGPYLDVNETIATDLNPKMATDSAFLETGSRSRNSGYGVVIQHDSRDMTTNAYSGLLFEFLYAHYDKYLAAENRFDIVEIDFRYYKELRPRKVLAFQTKSRFTTSSTPYTELSMIGSPFDLRGYFWGRFRDNHMSYLLLEYRHMFQRKKPNKKGSMDSRFGFVAWTGQGMITPERRKSYDWIPNIGVGLRFEVQERMNLRIDYGVGKESSSLYFSFNEAF